MISLKISDDGKQKVKIWYLLYSIVDNNTVDEFFIILNPVPYLG